MNRIRSMSGTVMQPSSFRRAPPPLFCVFFYSTVRSWEIASSRERLLLAVARLTSVDRAVCGADHDQSTIARRSRGWPVRLRAGVSFTARRRQRL